MDWRGVFFQKPIMAVLARYLAIVDFFKLSALDKTMYKKWISSDCIDAIDMRALVKRRFNWTYVKANPFVWVRKHMAAARMPLPVDKLRFRCTGGCGKMYATVLLISRQMSKYAICCFCMFPDGWEHGTAFDKFGTMYDLWTNAVSLHLNILRTLFKEKLRGGNFWSYKIYQLIDVEAFDFKRVQNTYYRNEQMISEYETDAHSSIIKRDTIIQNAEADFLLYRPSEEAIQHFFDEEEVKRRKIESGDDEEGYSW